MMRYAVTPSLDLGRAHTLILPCVPCGASELLYLRTPPLHIPRHRILSFFHPTFPAMLLDKVSGLARATFLTFLVKAVVAIKTTNTSLSKHGDV